MGTVFIFSGIEPGASDIARMKSQGVYDAFLKHETLRVLAPYMVLGVIVVIWAVLVFRAGFPAIVGDSTAVDTRKTGGYLRMFRYRHLLAAVIAQFSYEGAQVGTWSYFIQYAQDYTHVGEKLAGYLLTATLAAFAVGRFASSYLMKRLQPEKMLGSFALINIVLVSIGILRPGWGGLIALLATSFFMSLMYPTIFALGIRDLGEHTKEGASLLVMAIIGAAIFTPLMGAAYQMTKSMAESMAIPLCCYVVVAAFAFWGSHTTPHATASERPLREVQSEFNA